MKYICLILAILAFGCSRKPTTVTMTVVRIDEPEITQVSKPQKVVERRLETVYFDYDDSRLRQDQLTTLENNARLLYHTNITITVEGHCDERGGEAYNIALGFRRAQAVKAYMIDYGIDADKIRVESYGKERPVCSQSIEACWGQNRRVEFKNGI